MSNLDDIGPCCDLCADTNAMVKAIYTDHQRLMAVLNPYLSGEKELPIPPQVRMLLGMQ